MARGGGGGKIELESRAFINGSVLNNSQVVLQHLPKLVLIHVCHLCGGIRTLFLHRPPLRHDRTNKRQRSQRDGKVESLRESTVICI